MAVAMDNLIDDFQIPDEEWWHSTLVAESTEKKA